MDWDYRWIMMDCYWIMDQWDSRWFLNQWDVMECENANNKPTIWEPINMAMTWP